MTFAATPAVCGHCGQPLSVREEPRGRPVEYCDSRCRQAAHRARRNRGALAAAPPPGDSLDARVLELAHDLQDDVRRLVQGLSGEETSALDHVAGIVAIGQRVQNLTGGLVARARRERHTWEQLARELRISPETARRTYRAAVIQRMLHHPQGPAAPDPGRPWIGEQEPTTDDPRPLTTESETEMTHEPEAPTGALLTNHLAPVLAQLHRRSGLSLRTVGQRAGVSPSHLSRILAGHSLPSWEVTERLAHAYGADLEVLHRVWGAARVHAATAATKAGPAEGAGR
ncbi:hypothetical protein GCM10027168_25460 [Streptomyces capparidis]